MSMTPAEQAAWEAFKPREAESNKPDTFIAGMRAERERTRAVGWQWFGNAGHHILGSRCRFHLTTRVGDYLVSTVGEWFQGDEIQEIGAGRTFETYVFDLANCNYCECGCGIPRPASWLEIDAVGSNTAREATANHMMMCRKYDALAGDADEMD